MKLIYCLIFNALLMAQALNAQTKLPSNKVATTPFVLGFTHHIKSIQLGENRTLNIYLPPAYKKSNKDSYPVIYLLDGSANEDFIHIVGIVQFLNMIEVMPNSIIVGIANVDRKRDFTYPTQNKQDLKNMPTTGGSSKFIAFIEKEVQPFINERYRTNSERTIIGQSLGGLLATEILLKKPELFNRYIIVSPSLWWNDESLLTDGPALLNKQQFNSAQVYISVGSEGKQMEDDAKNLSQLLISIASKGLKVNFAPMPEENHLTILHLSVYKAFQMLYKKQ
jgi:predicted alpha/beta superfamily hydrolase